MVENVSENPAVQVAKQQKTGAGIHVTRTGIRVKIRAFPEMLARRAVLAIKDPPVPVYFNEDKGREEPNPHDPDYLAAKEEAEQRRGDAGIDAALLFGVELLDPLPDNDLWLKKLAYLNIEIDPTDALSVELAYLKYVAFSSSDDLSVLTGQVSVTEAGVAEELATFPGDTERDTD